MIGQSPGGSDLRVRYERGSNAPVWTGDSISGKEVIGFCHDNDGDHILLEGDESLPEPPSRPLTCAGEPAGLEHTGLSPVASLPADLLQPAPADLGTAIEGTLSSREDGLFVRGLLDEISGRQHHAWLIGGAVRDLLALGPDAEVKDFDLTGTIGPVCLDAMVSLRRASGLGDYIPWFSPESNVWSVTQPGQRRKRLVEYKPLSRPGFRFPVWGGGLAEDVTTRDLTFNALYYDRATGVLADPCGMGRSHLSEGVMVTPLRSTDPVEQGCVVLRSMKFRLRFPQTDISQMVAWIREELPEDFAARVSDVGWGRLVMARRWSVLPELQGRDELATAAEFGQKAMQLVLEIGKRA